VTTFRSQRGTEIPAASPPRRRPLPRPGTVASRPPERIQRVFEAKLGSRGPSRSLLRCPRLLRRPAESSDAAGECDEEVRGIEVALKKLSLFPRPSHARDVSPVPAAWPRPPFLPFKVSIVFEWTMPDDDRDHGKIPVASPPRPPFRFAPRRLQSCSRRTRRGETGWLVPLASTWAAATNKSPFTSLRPSGAVRDRAGSPRASDAAVSR